MPACLRRNRSVLASPVAPLMPSLALAAGLWLPRPARGALLVGALLVATLRRLRDGRLLAPEPVAMLTPAAPA